REDHEREGRNPTWRWATSHDDGERQAHWVHAVVRHDRLSGHDVPRYDLAFACGAAARRNADHRAEKPVVTVRPGVLRSLARAAEGFAVSDVHRPGGDRVPASRLDFEHASRAERSASRQRWPWCHVPGGLLNR